MTLPEIEAERVAFEADALPAMLDAYNTVWQSWPGGIDAANVQRVREAAMQAALHMGPIVSASEKAKLEAERDGARAEVARCHARLEIDHVFELRDDSEELVRVDVAQHRRASLPDAVECRDATIALLEESAEASSARVRELDAEKEALLAENHVLGNGIDAACDIYGQDEEDNIPVAMFEALHAAAQEARSIARQALGGTS